MPVFTIASLLYGVFLISSGVYRYFLSGSKNALWFGMIMGTFALLACFLSLKKNSNLPYYIQLVVIVFVGGFFTKKILGDIEGDSFLRVISLIIFSIIMAILTGLALKNKKT